MGENTPGSCRKSFTSCSQLTWGLEEVTVSHTLAPSPSLSPLGTKRTNEKEKGRCAVGWSVLGEKEERISGGLLQGTALTWEVACAPWRACSRAISAASSSVLLNKVRGSLKCSKSSLTRAWKEPQDTDTTFPLGLYHRAGSLSKFGWVMGMKYGEKGRNKSLLLLIIGPQCAQHLTI